MKRMGLSALTAVLLCLLLCTTCFAEPLLIPVGQTVGLQLRDNTVTIAAFDDHIGPHILESGLKIGDCIIKVNGIPVHSAAEIQKILDTTGAYALLTIRRGSKELELKLKTEATEAGVKLGLYLKQGVSGIGTVTWYDPATGKFGALGHGVNDSGGVLLRMTEGSTFPASVQSVAKGKSGHPGQLKGNCETGLCCGNLLKNTPQGVFGKSRQGWLGEPIPVASESQLHTGQASIRSTVSGELVQDYSVEIIKVYPADRADGRNLLIKVTDPSLLDTTGGIVQGMSGSPILQDGRIIGAVTHVLVNDPTMGYGIFIGNMLNAAA